MPRKPIRTGYDRSRIRDIDARGVFGVTDNANPLDFLKYSTFIKGRMFGRWIDSVNGSSRSNGYDEGDLIECPPYILESILRDELFTERDLEITGGGLNIFTCTDLKSGVDDYYNNSIYYNVDNDFLSYIIDYSGSGHSAILAANDGAVLNGDRFCLTNVQGDNKIDYATFDLLGNTTDGLRKDWKFARSMQSKTVASDIIEKLLYEMRCIITPSNNIYKIIALDESTALDTWTKPLMHRGSLLASAELTTKSQLYNDYRIRYNYHHGERAYTKSLFVNKSGYSSELTSGATYQATCKTIYES